MSTYFFFSVNLLFVKRTVLKEINYLKALGGTETHQGGFKVDLESKEEDHSKKIETGDRFR